MHNYDTMVFIYLLAEVSYNLYAIRINIYFLFIPLKYGSPSLKYTPLYN